MNELKQKSWFSRYWGWLLGGGCLLIIIVVVLVGVGAFYKLSHTIKESQPYSHAYTTALENKKVIMLLGEPIKTNGMGKTNYKYINGTTNASLTIPIKGPNDEGQIIVEAEKINNEWSYNSLYVKIDGENEVIYLDKNQQLLDNGENEEYDSEKDTN